MLSACSGAGDTAEPVTLRLMTHDSFDISQETIDAFSEQTGHQVEV